MEVTAKEEDTPPSPLIGRSHESSKTSENVKQKRREKSLLVAILSHYLAQNVAREDPQTTMNPQAW